MGNPVQIIIAPIQEVIREVVRPVEEIVREVVRPVEEIVQDIGEGIEDIGEAINDGLGEVGRFVNKEVIAPVGKTVGGVIQNAVDNPVKTALQIGAVATGNAWALPLIEGADVAAKGGKIEDVATAMAVAYVAGEVAQTGGQYYTSAATTATGNAVAGQIIGQAATAATVAVVTGQDPMEAFVNGGIGAGVGAIMGKASENSTYASLPKTVQGGISAAVTAALTNNPNPNAAIMSGMISASGIVSDAIKSYDPENGTANAKLSKTQTALATDILMGTTMAALRGGSASTAINAALIKAGTKALGDMATTGFKNITTGVDLSYSKTSLATDKLSDNYKAQLAAKDKYDGTAAEVNAKVEEQNRLKGVYDQAVKDYDANRTTANSDAAEAALAAYNAYAKNLSAEYTNKYKPVLDSSTAELTTLQKDKEALKAEYDTAMGNFGTETDKLSDVLKPAYEVTEKAIVSTLDPKFNAEEYKTLNGLDADVDAYQHFLTKGQFENAPTHEAAASPILVQERSRLINAALAEKGVTMDTADPAEIDKIIDNINARYGNNVNALKGASAQDIISGNTTTINKLVADQKSGTFRVEVNGSAHGDWNKPPADTFKLPAGTKLASFEAFDKGTAALVYSDKGAPVWVEADKNSGVATWNPATGNYELPEVVIIGQRPSNEGKIIAMAKLGGEEVTNGLVSDAMIKAAQTVVGWAKETGNSTVINASANVMKAAGGFLDSINGASVLAGYAPPNTSLGKFAKALEDIGKAGNTTQYQAAIKNMNTMIGDAKGVGGTLQAIYGAFKSAPIEFVAEYIGVEGVQELAPLLIGGVVAGGAKGAALALKYGQAVAARMGTAAGMTTSILTDITESAGGAASSAYTEAYKIALKSGKTEAQADKIAMEIAQRQALIAGSTTAVTMGIGGAALEKAIFNRTGTKVGDAFQALGDFAKNGTKITIKEGVIEGGEEGVSQAALEAQLYKLDPTRPVAKNITAAVAFGAIAGGPIAGGAYGASRTGDVISNALQGNPYVADILETNKANPAAAEAALVKFGITDGGTKSNLMNTIDNSNYTSSDEAAVVLGKRDDYTYSDADIIAMTGKGTDDTLDARAEAYVDPKVFDVAEVKAAAAAEGYTISDEDAAKLVGQKDETAAVTATKAEFDPLATTPEEAKTAFAAKEYNPTAEELAEYVGNKNEADTLAAINTYVDPRQVTYAEAKKALVDAGYTNATDAEIKQFVGQVNAADYQTKQQTAATAYADPRVVDEGEVKAAYEAIGLKKPTAADIQKLMGQYDEGSLTDKASENLPTARYNSIIEQIETIAGGNLSQEAKDAIDTIKNDLGKQVTDLGYKIDANTGTVTKQIGAVEKSLSDKIAANEQAGLTREQATQKAVDDLAKELGTTRADVLAKLGATEANLGTRVDALTEATKTQIGEIKSDAQIKYDALTQGQKDLADALVKQGVDTNTAIDTAVKEVKTTIGQDTQQANKTDLDTVIRLLEQNGAYDPQYDYDGNKVIDQKDRIAIETYLSTQQPGYKPDTDEPFVYNPAAGSKWAPTGVYATIADQAEATRQATAAEAEKTRQANAVQAAKTRAAQGAAALKTQRMSNLNSMMGMLGQAQDVGGQQVTVKSADPAKIGYVYDFNSIFANPAQQNMFVSPYADGGLVDGSDDVNAELLKILKG